MADFNSLVSDVYTITKRPELVSETILAVKSATLQLHRRDFFAKDIREAAIEFTSADYLQAIQYRTLFPRYRAMKYLRKFDPTVSDTRIQAGDFFTLLTTEQVLDSYGATREDVYYLAGDVLQVRSSTAVEFALIGIYQNPEVGSAATFSSWIADESPYAIVYLAAANIFGTVLKNKNGYDTNKAASDLEMVEILTSNVVANGF